MRTVAGISRYIGRKGEHTYTVITENPSATVRRLDHAITQGLRDGTLAERERQ